MMAEGAALISERRRIRPALRAPKSGEGVAIAPGIEWVRMPLPIDLSHINLWFIEDEDGFIVVDTGMAAAVCKNAWEELEQRYFARKPLKLLFITHVHPDHLGLASWLQERHRVPVWMSQATHERMHAMYGADGPRPDDVEMLLRASGVPDEIMRQPTFKPVRFGRLTSGLPDVERFVSDGEVLPWRSGQWRALRTDGHAEGHLCLWNEEQQLLISGDQVLPTISPNIGVALRQRDLNPLASYLASLERLRSLPEHSLTLPSHGLVFHGLHERIDDLRQHHAEQLEKLVTACATPLTAYDAVPVMFNRRPAGMHLFLALSEAVAHLEYLAHAGQFERYREDGVLRYAARR
jgi:glyoxylase-like metal-dependent hydrolase (beta-lactamase superfamily II)